MTASIFHGGSLSGESDDNTDSESNKSPDCNFQANGDSEPRAIKFHHFTDPPNEIMLILATKVAFVLVESGCRPPFHANRRLPEPPQA
jgi:hypothetical protein